MVLIHCAWLALRKQHSRTLLEVAIWNIRFSFLFLFFFPRSDTLPLFPSSFCNFSFSFGTNRQYCKNNANKFEKVQLMADDDTGAGATERIRHATSVAVAAAESSQTCEKKMECLPESVFRSHIKKNIKNILVFLLLFLHNCIIWGKKDKCK